MVTATATKGMRLTGLLVDLVGAGAANALALWRLSNWATMVGVKTARIKRLKVHNRSGVDTNLYIGTGIPGVAAMPRLRLVNNFNADFAEGDLPEVEFTADITAYVDNANVEVQVEVEETG